MVGTMAYRDTEVDLVSRFAEAASTPAAPDWQRLYEQALERAEAAEGHCRSNWTKPQELAIEDSQAASWRHSVRAAARCCLKMSRRLRWRSWLKCNSILEHPQYH